MNLKLLFIWTWPNVQIPTIFLCKHISPCYNSVALQTTSKPLEKIKANQKNFLQLMIVCGKHVKDDLSGGVRQYDYLMH